MSNYCLEKKVLKLIKSKKLNDALSRSIIWVITIQSYKKDAEVENTLADPTNME